MFQNLFSVPDFAGSLEDVPVAELMGAIVRRKVSGTLTLEKRDEVRTFFFSRGELRLAISSRPEQRLGAFLRNRGQLTEAQLAEALATANRRDNVYFGEILLEKGWIAPEALVAEVRRLTERIVQMTFPWSRGRFRFAPREKALDPRLGLDLDTAALLFDGVARLPESERFSERLGDRASVPYRSAAGPSPLRPNSPAGLFLSRIDGKTTCGELIASGPGNPANAAKLLYGFRCAGWVRWPDDGSAEPFDRERFEETWRRIDWISHYELLGVAPGASDEEIRLALEKARETLDGAPELEEPALARKRDAVRARISEAGETLADRARRAAYDRELSGAIAIAAASDGGDAAVRRESAVSSYRRAKELIQERDFYPAVKMLEQAVRWAPEIAEYRYLLGVTQRKNPMWKERAIASLREAARLDPSRADISTALADALLDRKAVEEAAPYVERARAVPGHGDLAAPLQSRLDQSRAEAPPAPEPKTGLWERFWKRTDTVRDLEERARELERQGRELAAANENLKQLSLVDGLTGVGNRRRFDAGLAQEWARAVKERAPISVVMIDVDHFKAFNDALGHQSGDQHLQTVARALAEVVQREEDVLARYGGEEFAVVLRSSGPAEASTLAEEFRRKVERLHLRHPASPDGHFLTVSVGVATGTPRAGFSPSALLAAADQALYKSKRNGRNRVTAVDSAF
ncbi:MAG TPA: diguanylate cyclase [Thermoanaerobaculia bacterium]|nr:diguanylate cyclase [Thermoanaerobaculia bacterium]